MVRCNKCRSSPVQVFFSWGSARPKLATWMLVDCTRANHKDSSVVLYHQKDHIKYYNKCNFAIRIKNLSNSVQKKKQQSWSIDSYWLSWAGKKWGHWWRQRRLASFHCKEIKSMILVMFIHLCMPLCMFVCPHILKEELVSRWWMRWSIFNTPSML